jgi:queuine tRNA-ribosyltransferase
MLGAILLTTHNLHFLLELTRRARACIEAGTFAQLLAGWRASDAADDF